MSDDKEPDYTLEIKHDADGFVVYEGGEQISKAFATEDEAKWWARQHEKWHQPRCCVCGSAVTRANDPWEAYSVSSSTGADWMHRSCMEKFEFWAEEDCKAHDEPGWKQIPSMENARRGMAQPEARRRLEMPNWCHNSMKITGSVDEVAWFKQTCIRDCDDGCVGDPAQLDFNAIKPLPSGVDATSDWGTRSNACFFHTSRDEPGHYECHFDTAWSPPIPIWEKLGEMFSALEFSLSGYEALMDFAFRGAIRDGKLELRDVPVMWEAIDPKTGKTVSGTREDSDAALGERSGWVTTRAGE